MYLLHLLTATVLLTCLGYEQKSTAGPPSADKQEMLWAELGTEDPARAERTMARLVVEPARTILFLQKKLPPVPVLDRDRVAQWLTDLDSDDFSVREKSTRELQKLREVAEPALTKALGNRPSLEARRIEFLLEKIKQVRLYPPSNRLRAERAVEVLERIASPAAKQVRQNLARGAPEADLTVEAKAAAVRLKQALATKQ
jgi:hypothetical protein